MITEIVTVTIPPGTTREEIIVNFEQTAPKWRANPDLLRKQYLLDPENGIAGGVYLWKNKADAEKWHGAEFKEQARKIYGSEPDIRYFETPIVVDNVVGKVPGG